MTISSVKAIRTLAGVASIASVMFAGVERDRTRDGDSVIVTVNGTLEQSESTFMVAANQIMCELEVGEPSDLRDTALRLRGNATRVIGRLTKRRSVDLTERWLILARSIEATEEAPKEARIRLEITGKLKAGMMAIGGETTGALVIADGDGIAFEVDTSTDEEVAKRARGLNGRRVTLTATPQIRLGIERRHRLVLLVTSIGPFTGGGTEQASPSRAH